MINTTKKYRLKFTNIIANFLIECKPYKGRKTDYQKEIKPVLLKEETRQIEMFSPKYNTKKNS